MSPGAGVTGGCEAAMWEWEPNLHSLQDQQMLFISEPSLQPPSPNHIVKKARSTLAAFTTVAVTCVTL